MTKFIALKDELLRLDREKHHVDFLTTCKDIGLIPKFLATRSKFIAKNFPRQKFVFETNCLKSMIRRKYALLNAIYRKIYGFRNSGLYADYANYAVGGVFDHSLRVIQQYRDIQQLQLDSKLVNKIRNLSGNIKSFQPTEAPVSFVNLSNHVFSDRETNFLNKGPKYITGSRIKPMDFIPQLEDIVKGVPQNKKDELRCNLFLAYSRHLKKTSHQSFHENKLIKSLKNIPNLVYLSCDKSNRLAIMDRQDFLAKMEHTIRDIKCDLVTCDPLPSLTYRTNKVVKGFKSSEWPEHIRKMAKINPLGIIPRLFGVLKDHKPNNPIRPIVMRCSATTYFIEKTLVTILKDLLPVSEHVLSSTNQFIDKIQQLNLPQEFFMFSMDVISLYPSIDMNKARDNITNILNNHPNLTNTMKGTIIAAINLIISSNYFIFNKSTYEQKSGTPMGSPVSGIIAEFILRPLEHSFLSSISVKPTCWYRFVDDIFGIWPATQNEFLDFFNTLNSQDNCIQFTYELESNNKLAYLDVLLTRNGNNIQRSVYRKPHNALCTIPSKAIAPRNYKQAAYRSYIKRAMCICSPESIHEELNKIRKIAVNNGYTIEFVDNIIKSINRSNQHPPSNHNPKRIPLQYIPGLHEKISHLLKPFGIHLVARTNRKMKDILKTNLDITPDAMRPGVYEIPLILPNNQVIHYVGQTSRKLCVRVKEHVNDLKQGKLSSAIYRAHLDEPKVRIMFQDARIISPFTTCQRTIMRESLEIKIRGEKVCNEQDSCAIPNIWFSLI